MLHRRVVQHAISYAPRIAEVRAVGTSAYGPAWQALGLSAEEAATFLRILEKASQTRSHYELFGLLQGEIQRFIPHRIFISAWADCRSPEVSFDVVSAIPGIRTAHLSAHCVEPVVRQLFAHWTAGGRRPTLLEKTACQPVFHSECESCALHGVMAKMHSVLVHGVRNARDAIDSLYLAFNPQPIKNGFTVERFSLLAEWLISEIDAAFQKIPPLAQNARPVDELAANPGTLTNRQQEVMRWLGEGKTNSEIAEILGGSPLTVKNHVQHIFIKLGARNRTDAVTKYRHVCLAL